MNMEAIKGTNWTVDRRCSRSPRWSSGVVVFVAVLSLSMSSACAIRLLPVGDDPTANRPVAGLLHSGYFFPKFLFWRGVRTSPGSFRYAYVMLLFNCLGSCVTMPMTSGKLKEYLGNMNSLNLVPVLVYSHFTVSTLSDLITAFFIGLCTTQVHVDIVRQVTLTLNKIPVSPGPEAIDQAKRLPPREIFKVFSGVVSSVAFPIFGLSIFPFSAVLSLTFQDSYHPMEILTLAYYAGGFVIITIVVVFCAFNREHTPNPWPDQPAPHQGNSHAPRRTSTGRAHGRQQQSAAREADVDMSNCMVQPYVSWLIDSYPSDLMDLFFTKARRQSKRATRRFRVLGSIASGCHLLFVVWAFLIARRVDGVHSDVLYMFLFTTGITSILISCHELMQSDKSPLEKYFDKLFDELEAAQATMNLRQG